MQRFFQKVSEICDCARYSTKKHQDYHLNREKSGSNHQKTSHSSKYGTHFEKSHARGTSRLTLECDKWTECDRGPFFLESSKHKTGALSISFCPSKQGLCKKGMAGTMNYGIRVSIEDQLGFYLTRCASSQARYGMLRLLSSLRYVCA